MDNTLNLQSPWLTYVGKMVALFANDDDVKVEFETIKNDFNGIKIELDDLGVEVSFSIDRLKAQMSEYILKVI